MTESAIRRRSLLCGAAASVRVLPTAAHQGRGRAGDEQCELNGPIRSISMAPPHPTLQVAAADGVGSPLRRTSSPMV